MSSFYLKIFALFFMVIDHIGFIIFPENPLFRVIGRLAFPLFAYQMAVGFYHTKNKEKHILKLLGFAIICQIPHNISLGLYHLDLSLNIIFTFLTSLLVIYTLEKLKFIRKDDNTQKINFNLKNCLLCITLSVFLVVLGTYMNVDYTWYGILLTVAFYFTLNTKILSILFFFILINLNFIASPNNLFALYAYISLFDILFILLFNGKRGYKNSGIFYALYFLHLFPLFFIKALIS